MVNFLTEQRQHQTEEPGAFYYREILMQTFLKQGSRGCFYTIYSNFPVATKGPKTNLSSGKSQQKQEVQIQKKPVYTSFFMQHFMQDKTNITL
ncbi:hypothetical protein DQ806_12980 [Salmonella enterica subsp. enterica serovar Okatie]|nr:hypothetical protein [Salmonella enterica subsp. enterica serovar Okatie]